MERDDEQVPQEGPDEGRPAGQPARLGGRAPVLLVGPRAARRAAQPLLTGIGYVEHARWGELPAGPAVCIDARRLVHLSRGAVARLVAPLAEGAAVVLPGTNAAPWPLCGLHPPRARAQRGDLERHAQAIAHLPDVDLGRDAACLDPGGSREIDRTLPVPAVFAVAEAATITRQPELLGDLVPPDVRHPRVVLVPSVWCHHRDVPLVTLSMIVKNEAPRIETAIAMARALVDEVVVYDTGSDDATVAIARAAGARVRQGYWDDDFSRARNESMSMVRGDWVLILDGDDQLMATAEECTALRNLLRTLDDQHAIELRVRNLNNEVIGQVTAGTPSRRLFQRNLRYRNRVHEVPELPDGSNPVGVRVNGVWIKHTGYVGDQEERIDRNLRLTRQRIDDAPDTAHRAAAFFEYGRGLMKAGRIDEAEIAYAEAVKDAATADLRDLALVLWANMLAPRDGRERVEPMLAPVIEAGGDAADAARWVLATVVTPEEAVTVLEPVESVDFFLITASAGEVRSSRAFLLASLGRPEEASAQLVAAPRPHDQRFAWMAAAMAAEAGVTDGAAHLIDTAAPDDVVHAVGALAEGPAAGGHAIAVALWARFTGHPALVAFLGTGTARAGFLAAMEARSLLLEAGELVVDPLEHLLAKGWGDEADQMLAALVLDELAGGPPRAPAVAARVPERLVEPVLDAVAQLLPELLVDARTVLQRS